MTQLYDLDQLSDQIDTALERRNTEATEFLLYFMQHTIESLQVGGNEDPCQYFCQGFTALIDCREPFFNYVICMASRNNRGYRSDSGMYTNELISWMAEAYKVFYRHSALIPLRPSFVMLLDRIPYKWWLQVARVYLQTLSEQEPKDFACPNPLAY